MTPTSEAAISDPAGVKEFQRRWEKAWNDHDGDAVAALCAEDLTFDEPALLGTAYGREPIRTWVAAMDAAFPDHQFVPQGLYADVARRAVLVAWQFTGTHADTGTRVEFHGDDRLEFRQDGLISTYRCLYDQKLIARQLKPR